MTTASQILERKGYELDEVNDIVSANSNSFDEQTREKFGVEEPIHLWECYYTGDADKEILLEIAKKHGYEEIKELLVMMDNHLLSLAENYPNKNLIVS